MRKTLEIVYDDDRSIDLILSHIAQVCPTNEQTQTCKNGQRQFDWIRLGKNHLKVVVQKSVPGRWLTPDGFIEKEGMRED